MKKIFLSISVLLVISFLFIGCGKTSTPQKDTPAKEDTPAVSEETNKDDDSKPVKPDEGKDELGAKLSKAYSEMMKNKKYLMKYKMEFDMDGAKIESDVTMAVSGEKTAITNFADGMETTMIMKDDKIYMIDHTEKMVIEMPSKGPVDDLETNEIGTDGLTYVRSGVEGDLVYEEYSTEDGKLKYYFDGDKLVKIVFEVDGQPQVMDIIEMSDKVTDIMFDVPAGYKTMQMPGSN